MANSLDFKIQRVHRLQSNGALKAFADVVVNDSLLVKGIRVVEGKKGLFVSMPQEQGKDKKWYDMVRCISEDTRFLLSKEVLKAYEEK